MAALDPNTTTPARYLAAAKALFADATNASPPDLRPDMNTVNAYVQGQTSLAGLSGPLPTSVAPATARVQAWFAAQCHLNLTVG